MNPSRSRLVRALLCGLGLHISSAHALVVCTKAETPAPATAAAPGDAPQVARRLAGLAAASEATGEEFGRYAAAANEGWQTYLQTFGNPLRQWAVKEVRAGAGQTVLYPFSGPDLPSVLAIYPGATRYVMISDQYANPYFDPLELKEADRTRLLQELGEAWAQFGKRGFFVTQELNKNGGARKYQPSPSMIMMAFAARLGYEVRAIRPTCFDAANLALRPDEAKGARWASVRLELRKDGRDIVVDYVQQDISNRGLAKHPEARAMIEALAKGPVLLKAASHLPQKPAFSTLTKAIATQTPILVQDETGLEYTEMAKHFDVRLYGEYVKAHRLFKESTNPSLMSAYQERAKDVRRLDFLLGYEKEAGSAIQIGTRR